MFEGRYRSYKQTPIYPRHPIHRPSHRYGSYPRLTRHPL
ncbi:hypothetical protein I307_06239 [Cryptococcus deuterogattii 99/473]|uniref:Uncharacterized protein n=1 Tax=Cryptococcus deuterogattii Ram5 TaxID=1296110 RepID=A0A0D0TSP7_9TREE|nr:hypothetical protein I313_05256 [Cryptococcus deuterogattii Ram5]KIY54423.1 hypothetical protein I307_06239 [Cryptococcus deuterogattii 99/473]